MNNEIIISNIAPQDIIIEGGGSTIGITAVYVNGVNVTEGSVAYVIVPTKLSQLENDMNFITEEQDPTVPSYVKEITLSDINRWNDKQDKLYSGANIKTINGYSILGDGNLEIDTSYTAGTGIEITEENVINNTITSYDDLTDLPTIPTKTSDLTNDSNFVTSSELNQVAFSGDYDDLTNKPTIPTATSDLDNDSGFITNRVDDLINYYDKDFLYNLLPKVSDSGTFINLDSTYVSKLKMILNPTTLSQDDTPTPSSPQAIHTISGDNTIRVCGKNYLNVPSTYSVTLQENITIDIPAGTYTIGASDITTNATTTSFLVQFTKSDNTTQNQYIYIADKKATLTLNKSATNLKIYSASSYNDSIGKTTTFTNLMLVSGSTLGDYKLYEAGTDYSVNLGNIEYCKIGTYSDRIFRNVEGEPDYDSERTGTWYIKKNIGKVVLDGTETSWSYVSGNTNRSVFNVLVNDIETYTSGILMPNLISNYFKKQTQNATWVVGDVSRTNANEDRVFFIYEPNTTLEDFKTWLSTHNTILYYVLSTPTYTQITGTLEDELEEIYQYAVSRTGQTNISQVNNDLPFTIDATTLKDISNL